MSWLDELIKAFVERDRSNDTQLPPWRNNGTRMRKVRQPFASKRLRAPGPQRMKLEEFLDKDERNRRFQELRAAGTPHVSKFSTVRFNVNQRVWRSVWCLVRP